MNKTLDQQFEMQDAQGRKADCRVRIFLPLPGGEMTNAVLLLGWSPSVPDFATGPWLEAIISGFREGLAGVQGEQDFLLIEHYAARHYCLGNMLVHFEEEIGLVLFKELTPSCNSEAANLRTGNRVPQTADNAPTLRQRQSVYWLPLCNGAVEDVVGESLDTALPERVGTVGYDPIYSVKERLVAA